MLTTTRGIVLHHFKYSEKSIIAKIYTEKFGLQSYIINGVRSAKSKNKAVYLQPLSLVEINAIHKEKKGLQTIKSISLAAPYLSIPFNISKTSIAFFLAEVLYRTIKEEESNEKLFHFLFNAFQLLDIDQKTYVNYHLVFLAELCHYIGISPNKENIVDGCYFDLQEGCFTSTIPLHNAFIKPDVANLMLTVFNASLNNINLSLTNSDRKELLKQFLDYYHLHLSNFDNLKSLAVLEEVLN